MLGLAINLGWVFCRGLGGFFHDWGVVIIVFFLFFCISVRVGRWRICFALSSGVYKQFFDGFFRGVLGGG